jgi:hypothetical protein
MTADWDLPRFIGYLGTWSSAQAYRKTHGADPVALIHDELTAAWGDPAVTRTLVWPLYVRVGRIHST